MPIMLGIFSYTYGFHLLANYAKHIFAKLWKQHGSKQMLIYLVITADFSVLQKPVSLLLARNTTHARSTTHTRNTTCTHNAACTHSATPTRDFNKHLLHLRVWRRTHVSDLRALAPLLASACKSLALDSKLASEQYCA